MRVRANSLFAMNGMLKIRFPKVSPRVRRWLTTGVILLVAYFFARTVITNWNEVAGKVHAPNYLYLLGGVAGFAMYYVFRFYMWQHLFADTQHKVSIFASARMLMLSDVARFVPGNIWSVVGRVVASEKLGITKTQTLISSVVETLALLVSSLIVTGSLAIFSTQTPSWVRLLSIAGLVGSALYIYLGHWLERLVKYVVRRMAPEVHQASFHREAFFGAAIWCIFAWISYTAGALLLTRAFFEMNLTTTLAVATALPLSWFVGYVSFITPSGLGFREAAFAVLAAPALGSAAPIVAVLTRIGFLGVEFAWVFVVAWKETKQGAVWLWHWIRSPRGVVVSMAIVFAVYFGTITVVMQTKVITSRFDLGNMDQVVWNSSHGRLFQFTNPYSTETVLRYIHHGDIFLVLLAPLYWLYDSPNTLLIVQAIVVACGGWLAFRLARRVLGHDWLAAVVALAYLFYPTLQRAVMFDFHSLTVAPTFALAMVLAYVERRWKSFALFAVLFAMCKEELPLMIASLAVLMLWCDWRDIPVRKIAFITLGMSVVYFGVTYFAIMPAARDGGSSKYVVQYDVLGTSPGEMLQTVRHNPRLLLAMVAGKQARHMYAGQLGPVGFLPVLSPLWLAVAWPDYVVNLFNERIEPRLMIYHYQAAIGGFVLIASIFGLAALRKRIGPWWQRHARRYVFISLEGVLIVYILVVAGVESYRLSPLPYSQTKDMRVYWSAPMAPIIRSAIAEVPEAAKVSATNTVGAQLAHRQHLYQFPNGVGDADYIFVLLAKSGTLEWQRNHLQAESLASDPRYQVYVQEKNFTAYRKR